LSHVQFLATLVSAHGFESADISDRPLLDALLDSWDRNKVILVNLLRILGAHLDEQRKMKKKKVLLTPLLD
jgi:hypothetical protein